MKSLQHMHKTNNQWKTLFVTRYVFPFSGKCDFCSASLQEKKPSAPVSAEHLISLATSYLQKEDDEFLIMAKGYAAKMKKLTPDQLIFADRVITETLVEAQMGKLTRWTSLSTFSYDESDDTRINN